MKYYNIIIFLTIILLYCIFVKDYKEGLPYNNVTILLTTTVNVNQRLYYQNVEQRSDIERKNYYLKSIKQWLEKTNLNIVVVENSGYTYPELNNEKMTYKDRFELITFNENDEEDSKYLEEYHDKGAHEFYSIDYAIKKSEFIKKSNFLIKITGRYYVPDFQEFIMNQPLDNYVALRQNDNNRCEIVGSHINYINEIFNRHIEDKGMWAETEWLNRIQKYGDKVLVCPIFKIEETQQGSNNRKVTELFNITYL
jgi:hypothetical protein